LARKYKKNPESSALIYTGFCFATFGKDTLFNILDFALQHPAKLRFENTKNEKKHTSELGVFFLF
jgi:hypothetical protein